MPRRNKPADSGPSKAYLVSFGDTMTALLAFFIVLLSLAEDQTGFNFYTGTGSFVNAIDGLGLPGMHSGDKSARTFQQQETGPLYLVSQSDDEIDKKASGPDETDNGLRIIDREKEDFQRFLNELERGHELKDEGHAKGQIAFDYFEELGPENQRLTPAYKKAFAKVIPLLNRNTHRVEVVVWALHPGPNAWLKSARLSAEVLEEVLTMTELSNAERERLTSVGTPWGSRDDKRPVLSLIVTRLDN